MSRASRIRSGRPREAVARLLGYGSVALGSLGLLDGRAVRGPIYAQVSVADPCNHRCVMCPYHPPGATFEATLPKFGDAAPGLMRLERFGALIEDLARLGTRRVDLVGRGEPLLNPDVVAMVARAHELGLEVALTTNGSRLDASMAEALCDAGLDQLKVSLNAGRDHTYPKIHVTERAEDHHAIRRNIRVITSREPSARPHVTLSFTIHALNHEELDAMVAVALETGADAAYFQHLIDVPERPALTLDAAALRALSEVHVPAALRAVTRGAALETNLRSFAEEARARLDPSVAEPVPCYVGYYFTAVLGNGQLMPCCQIDRAVGRVSDEASFESLWNGPTYRRFRRAARRLPVLAPELETAECDRCYFRPHNQAVHRAVRPLAAAPPAGGFTLSHARRLLRLDPE